MSVSTAKFIQFSFFFLVISCIGCKPGNKHSLFDSLKDKEDVKITLSEYGLKSVPRDIGVLKKAKRLFIAWDTSGWTMYPPLSALPAGFEGRAEGHLPDEITSLTGLSKLILNNLYLGKLPANFGRLDQLDTLMLDGNRLNISREMGELKKLKKLRYLVLLGNDLTATDIVELKQSIPGITIVPDIR